MEAWPCGLVRALVRLWASRGILDEIDDRRAAIGGPILHQLDALFDCRFAPIADRYAAADFVSERVFAEILIELGFVT